MEFGIGIPEGNRLVIRSKALFKGIEKDDIIAGLSSSMLYVEPTQANQDDVTQVEISEDSSDKAFHIINIKASNDFELDDDPEGWGFDIEDESGTYSSLMPKRGFPDIFYAKRNDSNGKYLKNFTQSINIRYELIVDFEADNWELHLDNNRDGEISDDEIISGSEIDNTYAKRRILISDGMPVAYLGLWDMGYTLNAFLGDYRYMIKLHLQD